MSVPDKNVTIAKKCSVFPVEFVGEYLRDFYSSFFHMELNSFIVANLNSEFPWLQFMIRGYS